MPTITTVINQKGGVGKSTTAHALGAGLALRGLRVLFVDLDAQGNLSYSLRAATGAYGTASTLLRQCPPGHAVQSLAAVWATQPEAHSTAHPSNPGAQNPAPQTPPTGIPSQSVAPCDAPQSLSPYPALIPSQPSLATMDMTLTEQGKEYRLREALAPLLPYFDHVVIDTPPSLGILTVNALTASSGLVIPAQADVFSLQGIAQLYNTIETVRRYVNPQLTVRGILLTRYTPRAILTRDIAASLEESARALKTRLFSVCIRESIAVKEAQAARQSIFEYAPRSNPAADYGAFVDEFLRGCC